MADARIRNAINAQQARLLADLQTARSKFAQGTDRGTAGFEVPFREFLAAHLPRRLAVGQGEVIDVAGRESPQTDVLILDEDHPFHVDADRPSLAFIEFVAAGGELKTRLTSEGLRDTLEKSARFKALRAEEVEGAMIMSNPSDRSRFVDHRPYFLVAAESELKLDTVAERVRAFDLDTGGQIVDAIYLLDRGWVVNFGDGQGGFQFVTPAGGSVQAWVTRAIEPGEVLFDFFVWLSAVLPRLLRLSSPLMKYL
jgi:Domain of unknown function (DUF6602)